MICCCTETQQRPQGGEDRRAYRTGGPGTDKKADSGAGATAPADIQFVGFFSAHVCTAAFLWKQWDDYIVGGLGVVVEDNSLNAYLLCSI